MAESFFDRHFVRWSSRDSIEGEKISLLAVAEVIFSVAAYWWIAWYFDTYAHLLISVIVAPLVLLRSPRSIAMGKSLFVRFWRDKQLPAVQNRVGRLKFFRSFFDYLTITQFAAYWSFIILLIAFSIRFTATLRYFLEDVRMLPNNWKTQLFIVDITRSPELIPDIKSIKPELTFGSLIYKLLELQLTAHKIARRPISNLPSTLVAFSNVAIIVLVILIWFIPTVLYRYSIKSTFWLYLPLIYLAHLPGRLRDGEARLIWVRALPAKFIEGIRFGLAALTLGIALFALLDAAALGDLLTAAGAGETPVTIFSLLVVLDFGDIRPWQYFTLPSALLTIFLVLWLDSIRKDEQAGATIDALGWKIHLAIQADRVRSLLVYIWLALALYYFADYAYGRCELPGWMASWLDWHFGPHPTCPAPGN